jgi:hypothetical protein
MCIGSLKVPMRTLSASAALALGVAWTNIANDSAANAVAKKCLPAKRRLPMFPLTL